MASIKNILMKYKCFTIKVLKADTETLDTIGLALGNYLLRRMQKLLRKQLITCLLIALSCLLLGNSADIFPLLLSKIPVVFMLIACTLYFTFAPNQLFGKKQRLLAE